MTIKMKILIPMVVLTIIAAAAILVSNIFQFSSYVNTSMADTVNVASSIVTHELELLKTKSNAASLYMAEHTDIAGAVESGDRSALLSHASLLIQDLDVDYCTITDASGKVLVRTHDTSSFGDDVSTIASIESALSGRELTAVEQGASVRMSVCTGAPIYGSHNDIVGAVVAGYRLDTNQFVDDLKRLAACEVTIFLGDERVSTTVTQSDGTRATGTKAASNVSQTVLAGNTYTGRAMILGSEALTSYAPIRGYDGNVVGMMFVGRYLDDESKTIWAFVQLGLIITLILLVLTVPAILFIANRIVAPIKVMVGAAGALAAGDTDVRVTLKTRDEMSELARAFNEMIDNTGQQIRIIEAIAGGDLTVSVNARSDKDVMNHALESMLSLNNDMFAQIVVSAEQVSAGAAQLAQSSQTLSQGASEQTAAVEELSRSIGEVNARTKASAATAERAAGLARDIMNSAQKGSEQMGRMVQAVKEINEAGQSINRIIKVIDEIAFQTNILSLNASVEAARAGQHGKGFAVVADEVRSLALKSAEAAKDTGALIENSISKAELGALIADETAASLGEIVSGINESGRLVNEIADASSKQNDVLAQITGGVDQVAQVVRQNSDTAQENAAVSEQMSGQAELLDGLVSHLKIKALPAGKERPSALPPRSGRFSG